MLSLALSAGLKTNLRLDDLLGEFTGLRKAIVFMVTAYYSEKKQIKIRKWKRLMGQSPGETGCKVPGVLSQWSCTDPLHPPTNDDNTSKVVAAREVRPSGCSGFFTEDCT